MASNNSDGTTKIQATVESAPESNIHAEAIEKDIPKPNIDFRAILCQPIDVTATRLPLLRSILIDPPPKSDLIRNRLLPATARLGIPLYFHIPLDPTWPLSPAVIEQDKQAKANGIIHETPNNRVLHSLSTMTSPTSNITRHAVVPNMAAPTVVLTRADGKSLGMEVVKALFLYIERESVRPNVFQEPARRLHARLRPEHFMEFWKTLEIEVDCPVVLACGKCGKGEGSLSKCGKCGVVKYCSVDCQRGDWKYHKTVCVKGQA